MATAMERAFNEAGVFCVLRSGMIAAARREMERALLSARLADVRDKVEQHAPVTSAEAELAVRFLSARRTSERRGGRLVLPGMRGFALAGRRASARL